MGVVAAMSVVADYPPFSYISIHIPYLCPFTLTYSLTRTFPFPIQRHNHPNRDHRETRQRTRRPHQKMAEARGRRRWLIWDRMGLKKECGQRAEAREGGEGKG